MKVFARFINSIFPDRCRHVIGYFFKRIHCISHRHADAGEGEHVGVVAAVSERDGLLKRGERVSHATASVMGDQVEPRRRFIEANAQYAKLDV